MRIVRYEAPLNECGIKRLIGFWERIFGTAYDGFNDILGGGEARHNADYVYAAMQEDELLGTCHLTVPRHDFSIGGLGEVATAAEHRGKGIAAALCRKAAQDFAAMGGEALFLGTANPTAARLYRSLGWRSIGDSNVYVNLIENTTLDAFYGRYFGGGRLSVVEGGAAQRIPVIPLAVFPHKAAVLDYNTKLFSSAYKPQTSCMGLYPKYRELARGGAWFCAVGENGSLGAIASVLADGGNSCNIDGFAHPEYAEALPELLKKCADWARQKNRRAGAVADDADAEKIAAFESLGFKAGDVKEDPGLDGIKVRHFSE